MLQSSRASSPRSPPTSSRSSGTRAGVRDARGHHRRSGSATCAPASLERLLRLSRHIPARGRARLSPLLRRRDARPLRRAGGRAQARGRRERARGGLDRPLNWIHMPVPRSAGRRLLRAAGELRLPPETELYLGVCTSHDGAAGARRRIAAARRHVAAASASPPIAAGAAAASAAVAELLELHRALTRRCRRDEPPPAASFALAGRLRARARRGLDERRRSTRPARVRQRRRPRLVPQPRPHRRGARRATSSDGDLLIDYSGGTGILLDRLRLRIFDRRIGVLIVDASAKFLRVALEKYQDDPRVALRLLRFSRRRSGCSRSTRCSTGVSSAASTRSRRERDPPLPGPRRGRSAPGCACCAPAATSSSTRGNIRNPRAKPGEWILDETVWVINDLAEGLVRTDPHYAPTATCSTTPSACRPTLAYRDRVFLQPRPLDYYIDALDATPASR